MNMNELPTPRTDENARAEFDNQGRPFDDQIVDADFARDLERELAELTEHVGLCHDILGESRYSDTSELWKFFEDIQVLIKRLTAAEEQRDRLAEALRVTWADIDHLGHWMPDQCKGKSVAALSQPGEGREG